MSRGFFLVLEGPEGAGKSTLLPRLTERFRAAGIEPVVVREPGGTPAAEALRQEVLHAGGNWRAERELLYYVTARADVVANVIRPALEEGRTVLSDRYELSTLVYQGVGRGIPLDKVVWANRAATGGLAADLTLIFDLPPELGVERQEAGGKRRDRLDREPLEFHRRVAARYREEAGPGVVHLDAARPLEEVLEGAWEAIAAAHPALAARTGRR